MANKIVGIYNVDGISMEDHVKDVVGQLNSLYSVDVEAQSNEGETATRYGIRTFPTFMLIKNGVKLATKSGKCFVSDYQKWIDDHGWS